MATPPTLLVLPPTTRAAPLSHSSTSQKQSTCIPESPRQLSAEWGDRYFFFLFKTLGSERLVVSSVLMVLLYHRWLARGWHRTYWYSIGVTADYTETQNLEQTFCLHTKNEQNISWEHWITCRTEMRQFWAKQQHKESQSWQKENDTAVLMVGHEKNMEQN